LLTIEIKPDIPSFVPAAKTETESSGISTTVPTVMINVKANTILQTSPLHRTEIIGFFKKCSPPYRLRQNIPLAIVYNPI